MSLDIRSLLELDAQISTYLRSFARGFWRCKGLDLLARSADSWLWLLALGIVWILGPITWHKKVGLLIVGILVTATVILAVKFSVRRHRPPGDWGQVYRVTDPHSFPSGHAARAVMLVVVIAVIGNPVLAGVLFLWALGVSLARVVLGVHYLADVSAGAIAGVVMGLVTLTIGQIWLG
jgi:undecaprenyl-diphosphatase